MGDPIAEPVEPTTDDQTVDAIIDAAESRNWLRAITPLLTLQPREMDPASGRVQYALDLMRIAACERAARILRSDLGPDQG